MDSVTESCHPGPTTRRRSVSDAGRRGGRRSRCRAKGAAAAAPTRAGGPSRGSEPAGPAPRTLAHRRGATGGAVKGSSGRPSTGRGTPGPLEEVRPDWTTSDTRREPLPARPRPPSPRVETSRSRPRGEGRTMPRERAFPGSGTFLGAPPRGRPRRESPRPDGAASPTLTKPHGPLATAPGRPTDAETPTFRPWSILRPPSIIFRFTRGPPPHSRRAR